MAPTYNVYPAVDESKNFPPDIRVAFAGSPEFNDTIQTLLDPMVAAAIASDRTITTAAAAAVNSQIAGQDLVRGSDPRLPATAFFTEDVMYAVTDSTGHRTWLEVRASDGGPTARAAALLGPAIADKVLEAGGMQKWVDASGLLFAVTDEQGHRTWLEARASDGGPSDRAMELLAARFQVGPNSIAADRLTQDVRDRLRPLGSFGLVGRVIGSNVVIDDVTTGKRRTIAATNPTAVEVTRDGWVEWSDANGWWGVSSFDAPVVRAYSNEKSWTMWGDSLTAAGGARTRLLELMPGTTIANEGIGGQRPNEIEARMLGTTVTLANNQIPASGSVVVTPAVTLGFSYAGVGMEGPFTRTVKILGIEGTLSKPATTGGAAPVYTFTRLVNGAAVTVPANTQMYINNGEISRDQIVTIWVGRNNIDQDVVGTVRRMVAYLTPHTKRFIIISPTTATDELKGSTTYNKFVSVGAALAAEWGNHYLDLRRYFIDKGMADAGFTPTAEDNVSLAGDTIPPSLMLPGDRIHFNETAQRLQGNQIYALAAQNGWS